MTKNKNISEYKQQRRGESSFVNRWFANQRTFAIIALVFLLLLLIPLAKNYSRKRLVEQEIADIQQEINDFESKNKELKGMIDYLQSDQSLEEQARLNMGLKRPGETVAVIQGESLGVITPVRAEIIALPNWQKWLQYFVK